MDVAININDITYPKTCPFHPDRAFPELNGLYECSLDAGNRVYGAVRDLLISLDMDRENIGKETWNPFSDIIRKGDRVVIKPNLVLHHSGRKITLSYPMVSSWDDWIISSRTAYISRRLKSIKSRRT